MAHTFVSIKPIHQSSISASVTDCISAYMTTTTNNNNGLRVTPLQDQSMIMLNASPLLSWSPLSHQEHLNSTPLHPEAPTKIINTGCSDTVASKQVKHAATSSAKNGGEVVTTT